MVTVKIACLIVTYNRKSLLEECLEAVLGQTVLPDKILIVDNNSTDGTKEMLERKYLFNKRNTSIDCNFLEDNLGGAGGFYEGIKYIDEYYDYDFIWLMDDDTIPKKDTLYNLLEDYRSLKNNKVSFIASSVFGPEDEPMNVPELSHKRTENGYEDWYRHLDKGLVEINYATFVSLLIPKQAVRTIGYPIKSYFIWGDDAEYTYRLTTYFGPAFLSGNSRILHKRWNARTLSIKDEVNKQRIDLYKYYFRNNLVNYKTYKSRTYFFEKFIKFEILSLLMLVAPNVKYRWRKFLAIQKGIYGVIVGNYDKKGFKNRIPL